MPNKTWKHPQLGTFTMRARFGRHLWENVLDLPAFAIFKFSRNGRFRGVKKLRCEIVGRESESTPLKSTIHLCERIAKNQDKLVRNIRDSLFQDINGEGKDSGMWWRHDPIEFAVLCCEFLREKTRFSRVYHPEQIEMLIGGPTITIDQYSSDSKAPLAMINVSTYFKDEHGLGVLTNGNSVLGLGYAGEASPYR
jgi:hypothetical protein